MARKEEVLNNLKELIKQQNSDLSTEATVLRDKISKALPNKKELSNLLVKAEQLCMKYTPEIDSLKDKVNEDVNKEKAALTQYRNYVFGKSKNKKDLENLQKKLQLNLSKEELKDLKQQIAKTIKKSMKRDYHIELNGSEKTKEQIEEDIKNTVKELEKLISIKGNEIQNQKKLVEKLETENKPLHDMIKNNQKVLKDFTILYKGASFNEDYEQALNEKQDEETVLEGEEDLIVSTDDIEAEKIAEHEENEKSEKEENDPLITEPIAEDNNVNEPLPEEVDPIKEDDEPIILDEKEEPVIEDEPNVIEKVEEIPDDFKTDEPVSKLSHLPFDASKDFSSQYKNYMNYVTDEMLDEKGNFDPIMRSKVRSVYKQIQKVCGVKNFNGDVFFAQVYKKGFLTGKPKLFNGKISENNAKQLDQVIENFERASAEGLLTEEQQLIFLRYAVYPKQFNDLKKNPPAYEESDREPKDPIQEPRQESVPPIDDQEIQKSFQDELTGGVVDPNDIDEINNGSASDHHRRQITR